MSAARSKIRAKQSAPFDVENFNFATQPKWHATRNGCFVHRFYLFVMSSVTGLMNVLKHYWLDSRQKMFLLRALWQIRNFSYSEKVISDAVILIIFFFLFGNLSRNVYGFVFVNIRFLLIFWQALTLWILAESARGNDGESLLSLKKCCCSWSYHR